MTDVATLVGLSPVIPVLTIANPDDAVPLARALVAGHLRVLEVTLRTAAALEAIAEIKQAVPEAIVGAGTVLNEHDYARACDAGAAFVVSPGITEPLLRAANTSAVPLLPGVVTAGEIMRGLDAGLSQFKFFPAESSGGVAAVKAFAGPFASVRFCPTGGITPQNARHYLGLGNVACVGGTWLAPPALVTHADWAGIAELARQASRLREAEAA